ncbi:nitroreductase family protein [Arabiibacter massiliensis]|uniref:nitroreductase family protein n=1 Tax=Arabiibacter massiliensis TaxID=1870985 RepID=UPI0009B9A121|nr:nitroreductase family protein [Arabiibacter massiliensis]
MTEAIFKRASVRRFTDEPVTDDEVRALLRAAMAAPSAGNQQPWEFYVVRDEATRVRLSEATPYAKPAAAAPCVIAACTHTAELHFPMCAPQDMSAAVENLLLEAVELGLGAVWLGVAPEPDRIAAVSKVLGLPEGVEPFALVACGRPAEEPAPKGRDRFDESRIRWIS